MKCVCGYEEHDAVYEDVEVRYKKGPRAGQVRGTQTRCTREKNRRFIKVEVERGFGFVVDSGDRWSPKSSVEIYACPECGTLKLVCDWLVYK